MEGGDGTGCNGSVIATAPNAARVFVFPNQYEAGRAFVVVYNFGAKASVDVDLSGVLAVAKSFAIRNVQDVFGTPIVSGTYAGGMVSIPLGGVQAPVPIGRATVQPPKTGPAFDVFLVTGGS